MEYIPVRVSTLRGEQKIPFQLFVKIGAKHILYIKEGANFEGERLKKLKAKKLRKMFILPEHEEAYRAYVTQNIEMAYDQSSGTLESRSQIIQGIQEVSAEEVMENPDNEKIYQQTKVGTNRYVDFLLNEDQAIQSILNIENTDQNIAHHGVSVSTYAVALAQKMGQLDLPSIKMLALGSLIHDMAHFKKPETFFPHLAEITPEQKELYRSHPLEGASCLKDQNHIDPQVINIILQHHETIDGEGFPNRLRDSKIDPLALITGLANALDRMISFEKASKEDAAKSLLVNFVGRYPLEYLQAMQKVASSL